MVFRDDRDALRAQREALEGEVNDLTDRLEEAKRELRHHEDKDEQDEAELARLRDEVESLRARLGEVPEAPKKKNPQRAMVIASLVSTVGVAAGFFLTQQSVDEPPTPRGLGGSASAAAAGGQPRVATPPQPTPLDIATFGAVVLSSEGIDVSAGDGCVLEVRIAGPNRLGHTTVRCGDVIYDSRTDAGTSITSSSSQLTTHVRPDGAFEHSVKYVDVGTRTGPRPQISVDTQAQRMRVWSEGAEPFDVHFYVDDRSGPWMGRTVTDGRRDASIDRLHLRALATDTSGPYPEAADGGCELMGHAEAETGLDCRTLLRCGETILYGAGTTGYNDCQVDPGQGGALIATANDTETTASNSDPVFLLDVPGRRVTVADEREGTRWQVEMALSEDPRCDLDGTWTGVLRDENGETPVTIAPGDEGSPALTVGSGSVEAATAALDCVRGTVALSTSSDTFEARFGPGFQTLLGRARGGETRAIWLRRRPDGRSPASR